MAADEKAAEADGVLNVARRELTDGLGEQARQDGLPDRYPREDGGVPAGPHPLAEGLRRAKLEIAKILEDDANLEHLALTLQDEFKTNPTKFLRVYEPLLRRYEEMGTEQQARRPVRIYVAGEAVIEG